MSTTILLQKTFLMHNNNKKIIISSREEWKRFSLCKHITLFFMHNFYIFFVRIMHNWMIMKRMLLQISTFDKNKFFSLDKCDELIKLRRFLYI